MTGEHAVLGPSAAERWLICPASITMEGLVPPETESVYAVEGTVAHALAELKASLAFGKITKPQFDKRRNAWHHEYADLVDQDEVEVEMERHTDAYVELLREHMEREPNSELLLEQRLNTGVPSCWGTSDAVIVSPVHVETVDFKYGAGVAVEAEGNPQLRLYALGALDEYGDVLGETEVVYMTIHQPRMNHILTAEITPDSLREWRTSIIPIAEEALGPNPHFGPSETSCRWCPASGRCQAQLEEIFKTDFDVIPTVLSPKEMSEVLAKMPYIREWLKAFEEAALSLAYSEGIPIPGYKVVLSGGKRYVSDQEGTLRLLTKEHGYSFDEVGRRSTRGVGELEKLLGKERFHELLEQAELVIRSEGKPALVLESDRRPAVAPNSEAQRVFREADE